MKLKLLEDLGNDKAGDVVDRDDEKAKKLIAAGIAKELAEVDGEDDEDKDEEKAVKSLVKHIDNKLNEQKLQVDATVEKSINKHMAKLKESGFGISADAKGAVKAHDFKNVGDFGLAVMKSALGDVEAKGRIDSYHKKAAYTNTSDESALFPHDFSKTIWEPSTNYYDIVSQLTMWRTSQQTLDVAVLDDKTRANGSIGGITASWTAEGIGVTESKPVPATKTMKLNKLAAFARATDETGLTVYNVNQLIGGLMTKAIKYQLNASVLNGTGTTNPKGMLIAAQNPALITVTRATANKVTLPDITTMLSRVYAPEGLSDFVFLFHPSALPSLLTMKFPNDSGTTPAMMPIGDSGYAANFQYKPFATILGIPAYMCDYMAAVGFTSDFALVNPKAYFGLQKENDVSGVEESIHLHFDKYIQSFRSRVFFDAGPSRTAPVTPYSGSSTLSEFLVLSTNT